tara:strand:- start:383 stop:1459 length:1077 start_codon:yes stop_codon:yes gene_type:complete
MKAAVCHEFEKSLVIEELELDPPQAGEVKVKLSACAICHSDIHYMEGAWGGQLPAVYGHEAAGVVDSVGPGVRAIKPGQHVVVTLIRSCGHCFYCEQGEPTICDGEFPADDEGRLHKAGNSILQGMQTAAFAEETVVHESQVVAIPEGVPMDSASLLACGVITGLGAVTNTAQVPSGSTVVVIGTGGVGLNSIQGARISGAHVIVAVDLVDEKLEAARLFGATHTVNARDNDVRDFIRSVTSGRGADYVFITVGNPRAIEDSFHYIRSGGTTVIVGMPAVGDMVNFDPLKVAGSNQRVLGSKMGATRLRVDMPKLIELYQQGRLKLDELISNRYPLEEINEAVASVNRQEALRNVIVF